MCFFMSKVTIISIFLRKIFNLFILVSDNGKKYSEMFFFSFFWVIFIILYELQKDIIAIIKILIFE